VIFIYVVLGFYFTIGASLFALDIPRVSAIAKDFALENAGMDQFLRTTWKYQLQRLQAWNVSLCLFLVGWPYVVWKHWWEE
jgi:hypothetical protein